MREERSKESRLGHLRRRLARRERDLKDIARRTGYRSSWQASKDTVVARSKIRQAYFEIRELIDSWGSGIGPEGEDPAPGITNRTPGTEDSGDDQASVASSSGPTPPAGPPPQRPPPPDMDPIEAVLASMEASDVEEERRSPPPTWARRGIRPEQRPPGFVHPQPPTPIAQASPPIWLGKTHSEKRIGTGSVPPAPRPATNIRGRGDSKETQTGRQAHNKAAARITSPETFPATAEQAKQDSMWLARARRAEKSQKWTTNVHGLRYNDEGKTEGVPLTSAIQCSECATFRIPSLNVCYACFPEVASNQVVAVIYIENIIAWECMYCGACCPEAAATRRHVISTHIPGPHVDYRYPFSPDELAVVALKDVDKYNSMVMPRRLPLRPGYYVLRLPLASNPPLGVEAYEPRSRDTVPLPRDTLHPGDQRRTASNLSCILCQSPGCYMICGAAASEALTEMSRVVSSRFQPQRTVNGGMAPPFPTRLERSQLVHWYNNATIRGKPPPSVINKIATTLGVTRNEVNKWFTMEGRVRGHLPTGQQRPAHNPTPPADTQGQVRGQLPWNKEAPTTQRKTNSGREYLEEGNVEINSDTDPLMAAAAYGPPFNHWGRALTHPGIDTPSVYPKENPWITRETSQATSTPKAMRTPYTPRRGQGHSPGTYSGDTTASSVEDITNPDDPRSGGTSAPRNLMETSTDSEPAGWSTSGP
jgi:ferredoxin